MFNTIRKYIDDIVLEQKSTDFNDVDTKLLYRYNQIRGYDITLNISYIDLFYNFAELHLTPRPRKYIKIFNRFDSDFKFVIINDLHEFNLNKKSKLIIDYQNRLIYITKYIINLLKNEPLVKREVCCLILCNRDFIIFDNILGVIKENNQNDTLLNNTVINDKRKTPDFLIRDLSKNGQYSFVSNPRSFITDDKEFIISLNNIPYQIYTSMIQKINGMLYLDSDNNYSSLMFKDRKMLEEKAVKVSSEGFKYPILINKFNGIFIVDDIMEFLIAQYLKLPYIPVLIYTNLTTRYHNNILRKYLRLKDKNHNLPIEVKSIILPGVPIECLYSIPIK